MYYLVWYQDGSMGIYAQPQEQKSHQDGARIFEVSGDLDVSDISEATFLRGFDLGIEETLPPRLQKKIKRIA